MGNAGRSFTGKTRAQQAEQKQTESTNYLQNISQDLLAQTAPLRSETLNTLQNVLQGGRPENFRVFAPERDAVESQYNRARENILATTPARGGLLNQSLADTELARARTLSELESEVRRNAFQQSLGVGFGEVPVTFAGLGNAASLWGNMSARNDAIGSGMKSGGGSGLGSLVGIAGALLA